MEESMTQREKEEKMKSRAKQLKFFVDTFGGRDGYMIERGAYMILEVYRSRPRAIWRYIRYGFRQWKNSVRFNLQFSPRVWWYRRIYGLKYNKAVDLACSRIEEKYAERGK